MREVKYRAWHKRYKEMYEVTCIDWEAEFVWVKYYDDDREDWFSCEEHFAGLELIQYTGLKDNNGVEIYEGDIVENGNGKVGYIVFLIQEAGFVVVLKDRDYRLGHRNTGEGYHMAGNHKVIGNVYTSPELLEEG